MGVKNVRWWMGSPTKVTAVAETPPNSNPVPVSVTAMPPSVDPLLGETLVTVGIGMYVYASADVVRLVPNGVVTVMSTVAGEALAGKVSTVI